ncbi:MAG: PadR family transcriptional regulator [Clostridiales bacterium]|nr:PadR family transcriptional regulator [Clostridiales bacterium]
MIDSNLLGNMMTELRRGTLTLAVLSQLENPQYGYSLLQRLEKKGVQIEANTLYPLMRRLESQGLLDNRWDTSSARPRKYYVLNDNGRGVFEALKQEWTKTCDGINGLIGRKTIE